jgi:CheY-like chemotaxis protein
MSLRILVIDDEEQFLAGISSKLKSGLAENPWQAQVEVHALHSDRFPDADKLKAEVDSLTVQRWDALLVDVNLYGQRPKGLPGLMLPIDLVRAFRTKNHAAVALVFSGNIQDHLRELFGEQVASEASGVKGQVERHVRSIINLGIADFSAKNKVADDAIGHLLRPPWLLRLEREFLRTPTVVIELSTLSRLGLAIAQERITFADIAQLLRQPGTPGERIAQVASELGVTALADLYA